ncbi:MAG: FAD-binding protein [Dehalococcoidia bacterium]
MAAEVGMSCTRNRAGCRQSGSPSRRSTPEPRAEFPINPGLPSSAIPRDDHPEPLGRLERLQGPGRPTARIRRRFETAAYDLVQDPDTLEVFGVLVRSGNRELAIRARQAVIMCTGGFENNAQMQKDYFGLDRVYTLGTPGNTGDGLKMLQKAGAEMWHLRSRNQSGGFWPAMKFPEYEGAFFRNIRMTSGNWIDIGKDSRRFYNEGIPYGPTHYREFKNGHWVDVPLPYVLPAHMIFDEATRLQDRICLDRDWMGWNHVVLNYRWSQDNSVEVEKGWIVKADSIRELAEKIGRDPAALEAVVSDYNRFARNGQDPEFGRPAESMKPIANGPFYAVELVPAIVCTTGGGVRNSKSQVIDTNGAPIPRLYEAGELGSTIANIYQNGSFLTECMVFGRLAGRHAVRETSRELVAVR